MILNWHAVLEGWEIDFINQRETFLRDQVRRRRSYTQAHTSLYERYTQAQTFEEPSWNGKSRD